MLCLFARQIKALRQPIQNEFEGVNEAHSIPVKLQGAAAFHYDKVCCAVLGTLCMLGVAQFGKA